MKDTLVIIPARAGSKGIKNKNLNLLNGIPLIEYSLDFALKFFPISNICISTDSLKIIDLLSNRINIPFIRPNYLSDDLCSMSEVISHAVNYYRDQTELKFNKVLLLQPTSPIRNKEDLFKMYSSFNTNIDMVMSVGESKISPEFNLYKETNEDFIEKVSKKTITRRQDSSKYYYANGSMYLINLNNYEIDLSKFKKIKKVIMNEMHSIDIDDDFDWKIANMILKNE